MNKIIEVYRLSEGGVVANIWNEKDVFAICCLLLHRLKIGNMDGEVDFMSKLNAGMALAEICSGLVRELGSEE